METTVSKPRLNPWTEFWSRPKEVTEYIIATKTWKQALPLVAIASLIFAICALVLLRMLQHSSFMPYHASTSVPFSVYVIACIAGMIGWIISLFLHAVLVLWIGKLLKGNTSFTNTFVLLAWLNVIILLAYIPIMVLSGLVLWLAVSFSGMASFVSLLIVFVLLIGFSIFALKRLSASIGQLQGFSAWRGFFTWVLAGVIANIITHFVHLIHF